MDDHKNHIRNISVILNKHSSQVPDGPGAKGLLAKGKVFLATLAGDNLILRAMLSNEKDTNVAYERLTNRQDEWVDAEDILLNGLNDERQHKAWFENILEMSSK